MTTIIFNDKVKEAEDYKEGDMLMAVIGGQVDDSCVFLVTCVILGPTTATYTLIPITEYSRASNEELFNSLDEMTAYYREKNVRFTKVDVEMNVSLSR